MSDYEKFLPVITPLDAPFWDSLKAEAAVIQRCDSCGEWRFIPREICGCGSTEATWTPIAGTGEVYTYTVVRRAPTPAYQADAPYVIAHVTLDEGPRMIGWLECDPADAEIGMPVSIVYRHVTDEVSLFAFQPR
jgi:uncharacterized OB-fold protein